MKKTKRSAGAKRLNPNSKDLDGVIPVCENADFRNDATPNSDANLQMQTCEPLKAVYGAAVTVNVYCSEALRPVVPVVALTVMLLDPVGVPGF
jgi:hypothetical protein